MEKDLLNFWCLVNHYEMQKKELVFFMHFFRSKLSELSRGVLEDISESFRELTRNTRSGVPVEKLTTVDLVRIFHNV